MTNMILGDFFIDGIRGGGGGGIWVEVMLNLFDLMPIGGGGYTPHNEPRLTASVDVTLIVFSTSARLTAILVASTFQYRPLLLQIASNAADSSRLTSLFYFPS